MSKIDLAVLKEQLNILKTEDSTLDQKFVDAFSDIFSSTTFTIAKAKTFIKGQEKKLLENNLELHRAFEDMSSKIAMAFELSFEKNKKQIEIYQKEADKTIKAANKEFNQKRLQTNKVIESENQVLIEKLSELQKEFDQNVYELNQEINKIKNDANIISKRLEDDFANKKAVVENQYESLVTKYSDETIQQKNNANLIIDNLKTTLSDETKAKDLSYLTIRKTHNTSSHTLNSFINEVKAKYQEQIKLLNKNHKHLIEDLKIDIDDLRDYHENAKENIVEQHNEKLNALNIVFDVQKRQHNEKNLEIITNHNINVTKINADLSATKVNINDKITELEYERDLKIKQSSDIAERAKIKKSYNKEINKLNQSLLTYVNNANQKLMTEDIVFQSLLFDHDALNVKHLNEWRFIKGVYDKERELDYQISVKKIETDQLLLLEKEKLTNQIHEAKLAILEAEFEKELLPIESQLQLSSLLLNRDINLLNVEYDAFKHQNELEIKVVTKELELELLRIDLNSKIVKAEYNYQKNITTLTHQLNIEKNLTERNRKIDVINLKIALEEQLLELKSEKLNNEFENFKKFETLKIEKEKVDLSYLADNLRKDSYIEQNKRLKIIDEIKNKNQRTLSNIRNNRNIDISQNEAEMHEKINIYYMDYVLDLFNNQRKAFEQLFELMATPVNPKITREIASLLIEYNDYVLADFTNALDDYFSYNKYHFNLIINNFTQSKYQAKHEVILNDYNDSITNIANQRKEINTKITELIKANKIINLEIDQLTLELESLKQAKNYKEQNVLKRDLKKLNSSLKVNEQHIKNLFKQRKPLEQNLLVRAKIKETEEQKLEKNRELEVIKYTQTIKKYQGNFNIIKQNAANFVNDLNNNYKQIISNTYLDDSTSLQLYKKTMRLFIKNNNFTINKFTTILNFWLDNYIQTKTDNQKIINTFNVSTERSLSKLNRNYNKFISYESKEKNELKNIYNNKINSLNTDIEYLEQNKNQSKKSNHDLYNIKLTETNKQISIVNSKYQHKLKLINDNLHYANNEYKRKLSKSDADIRSDNKKAQTNILTDLILTKKAIKTNTTKTNERAGVIISKYDSERSKHLKLMQQKRVRLQDVINKANVTIKKINLAYEQQTKLENTNKKQDIDNLNIELTNYRKQANRDKRRQIRKETKELKQNYNFKKKELYRNQK